MIKINLLAEAPRNRLHTPSGQDSKWAQLVREIESRPGLGNYEDEFRRDCKEFRENFRFKHDKP